MARFFVCAGFDPANLSALLESMRGPRERETTVPGREARGVSDSDVLGFSVNTAIDELRGETVLGFR